MAKIFDYAPKLGANSGAKATKVVANSGLSRKQRKEYGPRLEIVNNNRKQ